MKIHFSNLLGTAWVSVSSKIFQKPLTLECLCFPIFFPYYGNSLFPYFGNCMDFCFTLNSWETHYFRMFVLFPYFSRITGIHFSHVLGIVWISASSELFKKPINLKCLCFPILFPYNGNPLFSCFANCMDFCFKWRISETLNFEMLVFSHIFFLTMGFHFPHILGVVWICASPKIFEKPITLECLHFFPYFSRIMEIHFSHVLVIVWISASSKIFKKAMNLKCLCFPILFPDYANPLFPFVGNCMDFCFKWKIPETLNLEVFVFSQIFSLLWEFTFLIFWELYVLMPHTKYVRNP